MLKKIIFGLVIIILIVFGFYYFTPTKKKINQPSEAIKAVPINAAAIVVIHDFNKFYNKITSGNIIFDALSQTTYFDKLKKRLDFVDSISKQSPELSKMLHHNDLICSAHVSGANQFNFLFVFNNPSMWNGKKFSDFFTQKLKASITSSKYNKTTVYDCKLDGSKTDFYFSESNHFFICSFSEIVLESSLRQLNSKISLLSEKSFRKVQQTAEKTAIANVYTDYKTLAQVLAPEFKNQFDANIKHLQHFAEWTELDVHIKPNNVSLNGFTYCPDSTEHFLTIFKKQQPVEINIASVLPENTAFIDCYGISNINDFFRRYKYFLHKQGRYNSYNRYVSSFNEKYNFDLEEKFKKWIGNEIALVATEPSDDKIDDDLAVVMEAANKEKALSFFEGLNQLSDSSKSKEINYVNHKIYHLTAFPHFFGKFLGKTFESVQQPYYTMLGNYIVLSNSLANLRSCINYYESGRTLYKNKNYTEFCSHLVSGANIFIYSGIARSSYFYRHFLNDKLSNLIEKNDSLLKKFESFAIQISYEKNDLYYNNVYLKYNPVYKKETNSMWETKVDAPIIYGPQLIKNFYTNTYETVVQDSLLNLYLISNTGKILWKKQLSSKIEGKIYQIDTYKNRKLQMAFNTENELWVLDRLGKPTETFPISLKSDVAAPLSVFDYDNNRNYRLIIPCENGKVYNYDALGKPIDGWDMEKLKTPAAYSLFHFRIGTKDYIVCIEENGEIKVVQTRGEERIKIKNTLPENGGIGVSYQIGGSLSKSRILCSDSSGNIYSIYFNDRKETMHLNGCSGLRYFTSSKLDSNVYAYILANKNTLFAFDKNGNPLFQFGGKGYAFSKPKVIDIDGVGYRIGICNEAKQQIYLFKEDGTICSGFPLFGGKNFQINDINLDGTQDMVTCSGNRVYAYSLSLNTHNK